MTKVDLNALDRNLNIKGDNDTARTITLGQQVTVKDIVVVDSEKFAVDASGVGRLEGVLTLNAGVTSPTASSGSNNEAIGNGALASITTGGGNNAVGKDALGMLEDGGNNMGYGLNAGQGIVSGDSNMCIGPNTLTRADVTECTAIGTDACRQITGNPNLGIGFRATKGDNTSGGSGTHNVGIGNTVLQVFTTGSNNIGIGNDALQALTTGSNNTAIGRDALTTITTTSQNTAIGNAAGRDVTGTGNVFIGNGVGNTLVAVDDELRIHNAGGSAVPIISGDMSTGQVSINNATRSNQLNVTADSGSGLDCLTLDQDDSGQAFIQMDGASSAGVATPVSSYTTGNSVQGHVKIRVNGTVYWLALLDDPTS